MTKISVVIPVYKSENSLHELYRRLKASMAPFDNDYEIILVEDDGMDRSWDIILELSKMDTRVKGLRLSRNFGQHNALLCGIRMAQGEVIVTMDDDLQHPPEEIPKLLDKLAEGYDVVYGTPLQTQHGFWRGIASSITKLALQSTMGAKIARKVSAFRAFRTRLRDAFINYQSPFVSIDVLLTWGTTRFAAIPIQHHPRQGGESHYTFRKLVLHALNMMTGFSILPLQFASLIGFVFTLFGLAVLLFIVGGYMIHGSSVPGFPFLASVIAIFSGAQLFALGIIGEYLARMHFRSMEKPPYIIRSRSKEEEERFSERKGL
jgi:undecaprenyl-phosphate 4-deoxy-4-formamido-L-arabinose transferase